MAGDSNARTTSRAATDWRDRCRDKIVAAGRAIAHIRRGDRILISGGSTVPLGLLPHLVDEKAPTGDNEILHLLTLGAAPYVDPQCESRFRHNALFIGSNVRQAVTEGRADYTPVFLSEIPQMIRQRHIAIDVALISVTPPDRNGYCSLGPEVDITPAAIDAAKLVIAEVNPQLPCTYGDSLVHLDRINYLVEVNHAIPEMILPPPDEEVAAIAENVAHLIMDGATIQVGIGNLPDAVLRCLSDHNDLGIHSEMFSDGVADLADRGIITGMKKTLHRGKIVASIVMGTQRVYDFVHDNPSVEIYPVDYTNSLSIIAQHDYMIAINTALEVDLTGQVCSDSIGDRFYSGIGGQVDFIRGAAKAKGGKPIIALPSTAADGNISRIKPRLTDGAGVVTTRGDVHFVVTEYGIAYLHGKTVRERAMALIQIAHPKFRSWLLAEAKNRRYVYRDQAEPIVKTAEYPKQYEFSAATKDGLNYRIRPIKPTDEAMLHEMFYKFTQERIYRRFFDVKEPFHSRGLQAFCTIDYDQEMTLVASFREDVITRVIGLGLYVIDAQTGYGKAGFVVADGFQNMGVGSELIRRLSEVARERGVPGFTVDVPTENKHAIHLFEKCGTISEPTLTDDEISLKVTFPPPPAQP
jgi:acyl-CoA hydrolase/GNAT superfamily N-acetyltransferase